MDTSRTIEIAGSPVKLLLLVAGGIVMTAGAAALAFGWIPDLGFDAHLIGWIGVVFFALCTLVAFPRLFTQRGPVVTIAPDGIRDTRVAAELIPWRAVQRMATWEYRGQKVVVLGVDPAVEARLTLTRLARWTRGANRALGADGLCVGATGVKIDFDTLLNTSVGYWQASRAKS